MKSIIFIAMCIGIIYVAVDVLIVSSGYAIGPSLIMGGTAATALGFVVMSEINAARLSAYMKKANAESRSNPESANYRG